jgi:hypothetical protein
MIKKLIFCSLFVLSACAKTPPPQIEQHLLYCVTPEQYQALVNSKPGLINDKLTGNAQNDFKIVAGQDVLLRIYADGLLKVIGGCIGPSPSDA